MKLHRLVLVGASMLVLAACGDAGIEEEQAKEKDGIEQVVEADEPKEEQEATKKSSGDKLTLESYGQALTDAGIEYEDVEKMAVFIQATEGQGYRINDEVVELYRYVEGSDIFEEIKDKGFIEIEDVMAVEVDINGEYVLILSGHSMAEELLEIFYSLDGTK